MFLRLTAFLCVCMALWSCSTLPQNYSLIAENSQVSVVKSGRNDTWESLSRKFYGDESLGWYIADANHVMQLRPAETLIIPKTITPHFGIYDEFEQQIPILAYHNFGPEASAMSVQPKLFERQLRYLRDNFFRVISLRTLHEYMQGSRRIPLRSVVITIDDGYRSAYQIAFPLLKKYRMPATLFVYSDFVGNGGLTRAQIQEMHASGLIDVQPHSKTHRNFNRPHDGESRREFLENLREEVEVPRSYLQSVLKYQAADYFAYPYGEYNPPTVRALQVEGYRLGLTVTPGPVTAYSPRYSINRYQILGNRSFAVFKSIVARNRSTWGG